LDYFQNNKTFCFGPGIPIHGNGGGVARFLNNRLFLTSDSRKNLVRGLWSTEMTFQTKGAVPVQIVPVRISLPLNQNQSIVFFLINNDS